MPMSSAHGSFTWGSADSVGATYVVSGLSFQPALIIFWCNGISSATDAASETLALRKSVGFAGGTANRVNVATYSADASAAADCGTSVSDDSVLATVTGAGARDGLLDLSAIASDGFTAINDNAPPVDITVFWLAIGGDITDVYTGHYSASNASGDQAITGLTNLTAGATDQVLFHLTKLATASVNTVAQNDSSFGLGIATAAGASSAEQVTVFGNADDASATMDTDGGCYTGKVAASCAAGGAATLHIDAYLKSWDAGGFTLNWAGAVSSRMAYCVVKGGHWKVGALALNTTAQNNTASVSGLAFTPAGALFMGRRSAEQSSTAVAAGDVMSIGVATSTSARRAMGWWDEDGTADSEINLCVEYDGVLAYPTGAGAIDAVYDVSAFASDGFTVIVDDAPGTGAASEWIGYLTWGSAGGGGTTYSESLTETVTAGDARAAVLTALGVVPAESVTASEARTVNGTYKPSLTETGTAGDVLGAVLAARAADTAAVSAGDGLGAFLAALAVDTATVNAGVVVTGDRILIETLTESGSATDTPTSAWKGTVILTEIVYAADALVDTLLGVVGSVAAWFHQYRRRGRRG